jgi:triacylglycerol esterase/lipase EstA (alpha/beta hydrolase family)
MSGQTTTNVHLLVLIHGLRGNPSQLASMHRIIQQSINESSKHQNASGVELRVMLPETNRGKSTIDGIDWGGERVATEVSESIHVDDRFGDLVQIFQEVKKIRKEGKRVTRFSITGHSMGGLLARYVIGCVTSFCST